MNLHTHASLALLTYAANEGLKGGYFNKDAPNGDPMQPRVSVLFDTLIGSMPIRAAISDWRFDEAPISVAAWPTVDVDKWLEASNAGRLAGDVTTTGYLAREGSRLILLKPSDPVFLMRESRRVAMRRMSIPSDAADPLRLYPRCLS